ncbi:MAG: IPT/TIG domain-containing protein [Bryobacterales bacterium]|nr:IPT/TIG domain-containing protein [Bryobacterales bacterium]
MSLRFPAPLTAFFAGFLLCCGAAWGQIRINSNAQLPGAALTQAYSFQLVVAGGSGIASFAALSSLPPGINLSSSGLLSGTPTSSGNFTFQIEANEISGTAYTREQFTLNVAAQPLTLPVSSPANLARGQLATVAFPAQGGTPPYRYSLITGSLPFGLQFLKDDATAFRLEGTPRSLGTYPIGIAVTDSQNRNAVAALTVIIAADPLTLPAFSPPAGVPGADYEFIIPYTGGTRPVRFETFDLLPLPAGLVLTSGGKVRGTGPLNAASFDVTVRAIDATGVNVLRTYSFAFPHVATPTITTSNPLPVAAVGAFYSKQFTIDNIIAVPPGNWSITNGALPGGLTLDTSGLLSGTPTAAGVFNFRVTRLVAGLNFNKDFTLTVAAAPFQWTGPNPVNVFNLQYSTLLTALSGVTNGTAVGPIELVSGAWPRGFDLSSSGLTVAGTPSSTGTTIFTVELKAADGQVATRTVTANVVGEPPVTFLNTNPPNGVKGVRYRFHDAGCNPTCASNGGGHPYSWFLASGTLPPGLALFEDGEILGVPTTPGSFTFTVDLLAGSDTSASRTWNINIADSSGTLGILGPPQLPPGATGVSYTRTFNVTGGVPPITFALANGSLPSGLTLSSTGTISGVPIVGGTFTFDVAATDNNPEAGGGPITVIRQFQLNITGADLPPIITSLSPGSTIAGGPAFTLLVNGSRFGDAELLWNGVSLNILNIAGNLITAQVPALLIATPGTANVQVRNPGNILSNIAVFTIQSQAPVLESLNPGSVNAGSAGFTLMLTGSNFQPGTRVEWDGNPVTTFVDSANSMRANIAASQLINAGVIPVQARSPQGAPSNVLNFTINGTNPSITSVTPPSVAAGSQQTVFTVEGTNFETLSIAQWNGLPVPTAFFSPTRLFVTVPASLLRDPGTAELRIRNPNQLTSAPRNIPILGTGPQILSLSPNTAQVGAAAVQLTVNGANFLNGAIVQFNGTDLAPTNFTNATTLTATVPAAQLNAIGNFPVVVRNPDGQVSGSSNFAVTGTTPPPTLTSLNPATVQQGSAAFTLTLSGSNFQTGAVARWNGTLLTTSFQSAQSLTAQVPASLLTAVAAANVDVRNPDTQTSNALPVQVAAVVNPAPVLTALNPSSTITGLATFPLTLTGQNFAAGAVVLWNGTALTPVSTGATQITVIVPQGLAQFAGAATVQVRNPDGQLSNSLPLQIRQTVPQITSISPLAALVGTPEVTLTVNGQFFQTGATVLWNGITLPTSSPSQGQLVAMVLPASLLLTPGVASISVRNPDGQTSASVPFQVIAPPPLISSLEPSAATVGTPGVQLVIRGSGFRQGSQVRFNGAGLFSVVVSVNQITATLPAEFLLFEQTATVQIFQQDGASSNAATFQVLPSLTPEITQLTPSSAPAGSANLTLGIVGRNFIGGAHVFWNGQPLTTNFVSSTQLNANVPSELLSATGVAGVAVRNPDGKTSTAVLFAVGEALRITSAPALPNGLTGNRYEFAFTAAGGARPYRWRIAAGTLPPGLTLSEIGLLSGTPARTGESRFTVEVADATNTTRQQAATVLIDSADLDITSTSPLPPATAGQPYSHTLRSSAASNLPLEWSIVEGTLPAGLTLNPRSGEIAGIAEEAVVLPTAAGRGANVPVDHRFRIQVAAPARNAFRKFFDLTVLPATGPFRIITPTPLPSGSQGRPYSQIIATAGGVAPISLVLSGASPPGLVFADGLLEGIPTQTGTFNFSVTARDSQPATDTKAFTLSIGPASGPLITSGPLLPLNAISRQLDFLVEATDGVRPFVWSIVSGELPPGVTFDPVSGRLSGIVQQVRTFRFNVRVTDANGGIDTRTLTIAATPTGEPLQIVTQALPSASLGRAFTAALEARGGLAPYRWTLVAGTLPAGLRLNGDRIEGTPSAPAVANLNLRVTDAFGYTAAREFLLRAAIDALPGVQITGIADTLNPGQQSAIGVSLPAPYSADITGRLIMDFAPDPPVAGIDPALQFSTGGRSADFRIPAGQTAAVFAGTPAVQTGTVAGAIAFRLELSVAGQSALPANRPDRSVRILHSPPVISSLTLERAANGFTLTIIGFATTREMGELTAEATPAAGRTLQTTRYVVPLTDVFRAWYASPQSLPFGTQFRLTAPFSGDASAIQSLSVRLRNSAGESAARTVN